MVRILANGDIVQDNDPRVTQRQPPTAPRQKRYGDGGSLSPEQYYRQHQSGDAPTAHPSYGDGGAHQPRPQHGGTSLYDTWNDKLLRLGIPRWNIGSHAIEPLMTVMMVVCILFFGVQGLLMVGLLYFVIQASQRQRPAANTGGAGGRVPGRPGPPPPNYGQGRRLGR